MSTAFVAQSQNQLTTLHSPNFRNNHTRVCPPRTEYGWLIVLGINFRYERNFFSLNFRIEWTKHDYLQSLDSQNAENPYRGYAAEREPSVRFPPLAPSISATAEAFYVLVDEFDRLRNLLRHAQVSVRSTRQVCKRRTRWMTFLTDCAEQYLRLGPRYWCDKHGPPRGEEDDEESQTKGHRR
jgi:hypothetical protein